MNKPIIVIKNLFKSYNDTNQPAINNITVSLEKGKIYALVGSSGCGKTTLLNLIGTLDYPDSGDIYYEGTNYKNINCLDKFRANTIGFIFQFHHLIPILTLQENLEAAMLSIKDTKLKNERAKELLNSLGLHSKINSLARNISGGEKQRVAIARALCNNPKLILADEPTGNVDSKTTNLILNQLKSFNTLYNCTILIATHDQQVSKFADIILEMNDGKIISTYNKEPK